MKTLPNDLPNMPAFPSEPYEAHEYVQYFNKFDILNIQSDAAVSKDGDYMKVNGKTIKISKLSLLDLVIKLNLMGVTCTLLGSDSLKYVPAVFLANFSSTYCNFIQPTVNPFPIHRFERLLYSSVNPQVEPTIKDIVVFNGENLVEHTVINNQIYYKNDKDNSNIRIGFKINYDNYNVVLLDSMFNPTSAESIYIFKSLTGEGT